MVATKHELLGQLKNLNQTFTLGRFALLLFQDENVLRILETKTVVLGAVAEDGKTCAKALRDPHDRRVMLNEVTGVIGRATIKECFEAIKAYAVKSGQTEKAVSQPWFHFARLVRNGVTHDGHFDFRDNDRKLLPVTWNGFVIDASHEGQPVNSVIDRQWDAMVLIAYMQMFVQDDLA